MEQDVFDRQARREKMRRTLRALRFPLFTAAGALIVGFIAVPLMLASAEKNAAYSAQPVVAVPVATPAPTMAANDIESAAVLPSAAPEAESSPRSDDAAAMSASLADSQKYPSLKYDDTDDQVLAIQERLMELYYMDSDEPTDYFGSATEAAVIRFQRAHHLSQTGAADAQMQELLFSDSALEYTLEPGDDGGDIEMMQTRLLELGYEIEKNNGYFGTATARALSSFQTKNKVDATGIGDQKTLDLLYSSKAKPKVDPTPTPTPKPKRTATPKPDVSQPEATAKPSSGSGFADSGSYSADGLIAVAKAQMGEPYVKAGRGPSVFDCSGLVYYCLNSCGYKVGRTTANSYSQVSYWTTIGSTGELIPGDLIFFRKQDNPSVMGHVGIWLGGDQYIHASSTAGKVIISSWGSWARTYFSHGKRVF